MDDPIGRELLERRVSDLLPMIARATLLYARDRHLAEDATQEACRRALAAWGHEPDYPHLRAWMKVVARNCVRDEWRKAKPRDRAHDAHGIEQQHLHAVDGRPDSDNDLLTAEFKTRAIDKVRALPEHLRILVLYSCEGKSIREIAAIVNRSKSAVQRDLAKALITLASALTGSQGEQP